MLLGGNSNDDSNEAVYEANRFAKMNHNAKYHYIEIRLNRKTNTFFKFKTINCAYKKIQNIHRLGLFWAYLFFRSCAFVDLWTQRRVRKKVWNKPSFKCPVYRKQWKRILRFLSSVFNCKVHDRFTANCFTLNVSCNTRLNIIDCPGRKPSKLDINEKLFQKRKYDTLCIPNKIHAATTFTRVFVSLLTRTIIHTIQKRKPNPLFLINSQFADE